MLLEIAPGSVAVPSANNTGTVLCVSDAVENLTLDPAPAAGLDRNDLVICQSRGADLDGGTDNDFVFAFITGTPYDPAGTRLVPDTPPGAVALAEVGIVGGSAAINPAYVTDRRPGGLAVAPAAIAGSGSVTTDQWGNWSVPGIPAGYVVVGAVANIAQGGIAIAMNRNNTDGPDGGPIAFFTAFWTATATSPGNTTIGASWVVIVRPA
jgi:hypothetical protein